MPVGNNIETQIQTRDTLPKRVFLVGVNCLAFRAAQNGAFYQLDADCVGLFNTEAIPWEKNRQFLNLLARSGKSLFES